MSSRNVDPDAISSRNRAVEINSPLAQALIGKTIAGLVVGNIEVYADGEHTVSIQKSGFKSWQRKIKVSSGSNVHLEAELEKAEKTEDTTADSKKEAVQRPTVAVMEVKKDVAVAKPVAQTAPAPSTTEPSTARGASISTAPEENTGTVSVTSEPNGVAIYVDNSFVGTAPMTLKLKSGKHSMRGFKDGYQNWFQMVSVDAGQDLSLTVAMLKSK